MQLQLAPVGSPWIVAVAAALLLAMLGFVTTRSILSPAKRWTLRSLRFAVVVLLILAMLRPTLVLTRDKPIDASLILMVDSSRSMSVKDSIGGASRWNAMKSLLNDSAAALAQLGEGWKVKAYDFAGDITPLAVEGGDISLAEEPEGDQSALGASLEQALQREASERVLGVLLLSDGAQRAVPPRDAAPQVVARRLAAEEIPLYTFAFGQPGSSDRADLAIEDLLTSSTIFANAPTDISALLQYEGFANKSSKVQLLWETTDGKLAAVDTQQFRLDGQSGAVPLTLHHTPEKPGEYKLTVRAEPQEGELVTHNNEISTFVTVRAGGIKVLYLVGATRVGGGPDLEQRFVRAALAASPDMVVTRRLFDYQTERIDMRDDFARAKFDVVVLDDLDASAIDVSSWRELARRVREGAGLIMIGGYHSFGPGGYRGTPVADLLPLELGPAERQNFAEALRKDVHLEGLVKLRPTKPIGISHPIMQIAPQGESSPLWDKIPPLQGANLLESARVKPNGIVLAESAGSTPHPLIVAGQPGSGRVLAFAGDSTWRWVLQGFGDAHRRFWRQTILWLAKKEERTEGSVWVELDARRVSRGMQLALATGVESAPGKPAESATFDVTVTTPAGDSVRVDVTPSEERQTGTFRQTATPGDYTVKVVARQGDRELGSTTARFLVPDEDLELDRPAAEPALMAQLAQLTSSAGGRALAPEELPDLLRELADRQPEVKEEVLERITYWDTWPFFLLFVGLVGTEWYLRKKWGLV